MRFVAPAWRGAWAAILIAAVLASICLAAPRLPGASLWSAAASLATLVARGALWRLASGRAVGPGGLQLRAVEGRQALVWGLSALFLFVLALLFFVVLLGFAYAAASAGHGFVAAQIATWAPAVDARGRIMLSAVALGGAVFLIWAATRISLASSATAFEGRLMVLESWPLTRGRVWSILLANLLLGFGPLAILIARNHLLKIGKIDMVAWAGAFAGFCLAGLWLPMSVGLMAYFYERRARPA